MAEGIAHYSTAKGYVQSAFLLITNPQRLSVPDDTSFLLSFHMLLGFAVELYLKAYLQATGHDDGELRAPRTRHNLDKLLALAIGDGFAGDKAEALVAYLARKHETFEFRYVSEEAVYAIRSIGEVFGEFDALDGYVDAAVGASRLRGLLPGRHVWAVAADYRDWRLPEGAALQPGDPGD